MEKLKPIFSKNRTRFIDVVKAEDGSHLLQKFVQKYDSEEEQAYVVKELPDPASRYGDLETAISEAERLLR